MTDYSHTLLVQDDVLIVPMQGELMDDEAQSFQKCILEKVKKTDVNMVLIDVSSLETIDLYLARLIKATVHMVNLMDADAVIAGMRPDNAIILTEIGVKMSGVTMAPNIDAGLSLLKRRSRKIKK